MQCVQCRQNEEYRAKLEKKFGPWECPLGIPVGASVEEMPEEVQRGEERRKTQIEAAKERDQRINDALDALEAMVPAEGYVYLDTLRAQFNPRIKNPETCAHGGNKVGQVDQECCGGKIKKVDAFECAKHGVRTARDCTKCKDWSKQRS
jgi:hypothetical protein